MQIFDSKVENLEEVTQILDRVDINSYNQLEIESKIRILKALINAAEELTEFKKHHQVKSESAMDLVKKKSKNSKKLADVQSEINNLEKEFKETEKEVTDLEVKKED